MLKYVLSALLLFCGQSAIAAGEPDHAIHEELRALLRGIEQAINAGNYGELENYFHPDLRVTTINQEVISTRSGIKDYFDRWFGDGGYLEKLEITLTPDAQTELYSDNSFGIVYGSGDEKYVLADGRFFDMKTRWTATVSKDESGRWKILALHIGTNFLDNPILAVAENSAIYFGAGGLAVGLLLAGLTGWIICRRRG
jgi:ketosteroid isomerase-like protein